MATGDIWQVRLVGTYLSVPTNNIFYFEETGNSTVNTASRIADDFRDNTLPLLVTMLHSDVLFTHIIVTNWTTGLEQVDRSINVQGSPSLLSDPMPSFVTFSWKFPKSIPLYSSGGKRFAGVSEIYVNGNAESIPSQEVIDFRVGLLRSINYQGVFARPVVLVTSLNKQPVPHGMGDAPFTFWAITDCVFRGVSTQRSRLRLN